jgi:dsRNA-specific ribonuclease
MMKRFKSAILVGAAVAVFLSAGWFLTTRTEASMNEQTLAYDSVNNYLRAIYERKDVNEIVKWVKDTRFSSIEQQKKEYAEMLKTDPFESAKVIGTQLVNENTFNVIVQLKRKNSDEIETVTLPVIKENGAWKSLITGVETREGK